MKKSRFTDEQMVAILREADRSSVAEAAKKNKVSEQTIYTWRKHFDGLSTQRRQAAQGAGGRECQAEEPAGRARPGDRCPEGDQSKKMVSPQARREQVALVCQRGLSKRRACGLLGIARSGLSYELRMPGQGRPGNRAQCAAVVALSTLRLSAHPHLPGSAKAMGWELERAERLWRHAKLQLPRKRPRRRIATARPRPLPAGVPTTSGPTTSCSTPAPTASRSSA